MTEQMIFVPAGKVDLRDDRKKTEWTVAVEPFFISQFPVTQELYFSVSGKNPSAFEGLTNPVESVSWLNAVNFCNLLSAKEGRKLCYSIHTESADLDKVADGYRLPTEAEWLYACRAGNSKSRYGDIDEIAWYEKNSAGRTHEVGLKKPNDFGLYDMLGNVWEWCEDIYDSEVYGLYRVFRGGGWSDPERGCLATNRRRSHPTYKIDDLGFRIVRSP